MQMNRLFEIVYLLMERGGMTAAELAERFEVSVRTIYRDVDTLAEAGIPVYTSKGKGGGIRLLPDFVLNKSVLSEQEQKEILFALQSLKATNAGAEESVLSRLSGFFQKESADWIDVDFSHWGSGEGERKKFGLLKTGILENRVVAFSYYSSYGETSFRQVEPLRLSFKGGGWYLQGYCLDRQDFRTFKTCRMESVALTDVRFKRREGIPRMEAASIDPRHMVELELLFSPRVAYRVCDDFDRDCVERRQDGCFYVRAIYPEDSWVYGYLLSYGEDVTVLSPPHIRRILQKKAEAVAGFYRQDSSEKESSEEF